MKLEDRLRESLGRRAAAVRGDPERAWSEISERLGRRRLHPGLRRLGIAAVALGIASAGGLLVLQAFLGERPPPASEPPGSSSRGVSPRIATTVEVGDFPQEIAVGDRLVWVTVSDDDRFFLVAVDSFSNEVVSRTPLSGSMTDMVAHQEGVWGVVHAGREPALRRFDGEGRVVAEVEGLGGPLAIDESSLWAVSRGEDPTSSELVRVDASTGDLVESIPLGESAWFLTSGDGAVWVLTLHGEADLLRVSSETNEVTARVDVPLQGSVGPPVAAGGSVWVPVHRSSESWVLRVDGTTGELLGDPIPATVTVGSPLGESGGAVWFFGDRPGGQVLSTLDLETLTLEAPLLLDEAAAKPSIVHAVELAPEGAVIWIANHRDSVTRVDIVAEGQAPATHQPDVGAAPTPPPDRWCNQEGVCASLERYEGEGRPYERPGPEHCEWDSATFIAFRGGQYVRDEGGDVVALAEVTYDASAVLPQDARPTGWRRGVVELWLSPSELDAQTGVYRNVYLVDPDRVERLPHFSPGCV